VGRETEVLTSRIQQRGAEDEAQIAKRLETASWELTQTSLYDYEIVNDEVEDTARQLCDIIAREKKNRARAN
jgi:guanylate kinase